jgi:hypothetical protein
MVEQRYGHTDIQKEIIRLGEEDNLTVKKILELFGKDDERKAGEEIFKLRDIGLIKFDANTMDKERNLYTTTRLIWIHNNKAEMPWDPGEVIHDPVADYMYEQERQFMKNYTDNICQKCGKKSKDIRCINLDCGVIEDDNLNIEYFASPFDMIAICKNCMNDLKTWFNIPIQDFLEY